MTKSKAVYLLLFVLLCFSVYEIPRIETSGEIYPVHESGDYYSLKKRADDTFHNVTYLRIFFEKIPGETNFHYFQEMESYTDRLEELDWTGRVLSPTRVQDLKTGSMEFASETIYRSDNASAERLDRLLHEDVLFGKFFLSHDAGGSYLYVFYQEGSWNHSCFRDLEKCGEAYSDRKILPLGMEILEEHLARFGIHELGLLGVIGLFVVLCVEIVIFRSVLYGFLFSSVSYIPSIFVMAFFSLLKIPFCIFLTPVPILTLVLSTSYTLHIVSYTAGNPEISIENNLVRVFPVVSAAAATTLFGFLTMLLSPLDQMRNLGVLMSIGVFLSLLTAWYAIPPMLPGYMRRTHFAHGSLNIGISPRVALVLLLFVSAGIPGMLNYEEHRFILRRTMRNCSLREYIVASSEITGATHQFTVLVDTGEEYGFVSPQRYNGLIKVQKEIEKLPYSVDTLSITHFANWINGKIEDKNEPVVPKDEIEIGESLELLFSTDTGFHPESLITQDYSAVRVQLLIDTRDTRANSGSGPWKSDMEVEKTRDDLRSFFEKNLPGTDIIVLSDSLLVLDAYKVTRRGIFISIVLFYPVVFLFLFLLFKSAAKAFVSIIPSLFSALLFLGLMGYLDFYFSLTSSVSICMLIGVTIDDSVVLVQYYLKHRDLFENRETALEESLREVGAVIIKTTAIIVLGVSVLLLSAHREAVQNISLLIIAFITATLLTLYFIPTVLLMDKKERVNVKK